MLYLAAAILLASCSLDYRATDTEATMPESLPDTVAINITHKVHKTGRLALLLEAGRAETYVTRKLMLLTFVHFISYDTKGERDTEGWARYAVFHTDTENAEVSGSVYVFSAIEDADLSAESLAWENKEKLLTAQPEELVFIRKQDGSYISGRKFVGDFRSREVRFDGPVQGSYVWEEKKE